MSELKAEINSSYGLVALTDFAIEWVFRHVGLA